MKNDEARVSSININRIPRLLILVAESSRVDFDLQTIENTVKYDGIELREIVMDSILSDRQLIGNRAIDTELSIVYS